MSGRRVLCCLLPLLLWPSPLPAQVRTVTTTASASEDPAAPTGFVTTFDLGELSPTQGLDEALEQTTGVTIRRQSSFGQPATLQIRGGNPRQFAVLIHGIPVRLASGVGFDVGTFSPNGFTSMRLLRGPAATVFGAGALTGALLLEAAPRRLGEGAFETTLYGTLGNFDTGILGLTQSAQADWGATTAAVRWTQSQGDFEFDDPQGTPDTRINNDHKRLHLLSVTQLDLPQLPPLDLLLTYDQGDAGVAGPSEFQRSFSQARFLERRALAILRAKLYGVLERQGMALDLVPTLGVGWNAQQYSDDTAILGQGAYDTTTDTLLSHAILDAKLYLPTLTLTARLELGEESLTGQTITPLRAARNEASRRQVALAQRLSWVPLDGLTLTGAWRAAKLEDARRTFIPWTGALGLAWQGAPWAALKANASRAWRAPDFDELYLDTEFVRGNPDLVAERAWHLDAGVGLGGEHVGLELVGFVSWIDDLIAFLPQTAYLFEATNFSRARIQGAEVSGRLGLGRVDAQVATTWTQALRPDVPGTPRLPGQPEWRTEGRLGVDASRLGWLFSPARARADVRVGWRGEMPIDAFGVRQAAGWLSLDVGVVAGWQPWWEVRLDGTNLLDVRDATDSLQRPLPGRAVYMSGSVKFGGGNEP